MTRKNTTVDPEKESDIVPPKRQSSAILVLYILPFLLLIAGGYLAYDYFFVYKPNAEAQVIFDPEALLDDGITNEVSYEVASGVFLEKVMVHWEVIQQVADEEGVNPFLLGALVTTKSCGNVSKSDIGTAVGLAQISMTYHAERFNGSDPKDPYPNLKVAAQLLKEWDVETNQFQALLSYSGGDSEWAFLVTAIATEAASGQNAAMTQWLQGEGLTLCTP